MTQVIYTSHDGEVHTLEGGDGDNIMRLAVKNGIPGIEGECGGVLSCATCHVFLDPADSAKLPPMSELEDEMLDGAAEDRQECSRLACQVTLSSELDTLHVTTPEFQS
ncbi:2Fe-2S iron-sulfur cluster-binding protein [Arthrobacter sp. W4I7]|uniref:2Fe-2S iron-sulfur cluster-binding protein n=1 Tax=Arthrobacter sp. W4I7 TaxID=3042296 RepID=UPI00277EA887|nr:2Fe-2S iron-sulfur cluster-binding protein [Arthrobacter sp. W4I7]MDQ0691438.1 2Fe-2S ferredoxin [Arthrobacter sp. W4I7]